MHGSHPLNDEYLISAGRLNPPEKPIESYDFTPTKLQSQSSPMSRALAWGRFVQNMAAIVSFLLLTLYLGLKYFETTQIRNRNHIFNPIGARNFVLTKRSQIPQPEEPADPEKLNHLIISLTNTINHDGTTKIDDQIIAERKSTSIFESIIFGLCEAKAKTGQYPATMSILGPSKAEECVKKRFQWALKIPKHTLEYTISEVPDESKETECNPSRNDLFDCTNIGRDAVRLQYSRTCPELSPFLLACSSREAFKAALEYKPPWFKLTKIKNQK